jgi:RNA polymerase sigma factor (TIGR02999 family)
LTVEKSRADDLWLEHLQRERRKSGSSGLAWARPPTIKAPSSPENCHAPRSNATDLLLAWSGGDASAFDKLVPLVYQELRVLAQRYMRRERPDHTLRPTALVNEAYLRLIDVNRIQWQNRAHFLAFAAQTMRRILVEFARNRHRQKRGGDAIHVTLDDVVEMAEEKQADLVALSDALTALASFDARMSQIVELRFFGGLSVRRQRTC